MSRSRRATAADPLDAFAPATRDWFRSSFEAPTAAQALGWPAIAAGEHTLICAPDRAAARRSPRSCGASTGCSARGAAPRPARRLRVLYVSPLKALVHDVDRNLRAPLAGIALAARAARRAAARGPGRDAHRRHARRGAARLRQASAGHPRHDAGVALPAAHLRRRARRCASVRWVIVDEIHALAGHQARRAPGALAGAARGADRCGRRSASACRPRSARCPPWPRSSAAADAAATGRRPAGAPAPGDHRRCGHAQAARAPGRRPGRGHEPARRGHPARGGTGRPGRRPRRAHEHLALGLPAHPRAHPGPPQHDRLHQQPPARRAPRAQPQRARRGGRSCAPTTARSRASSGCSSRSSSRRGTLPAIVATSSLELGIDMGAVDLVIQVESPLSVARGLQRVGRAGHQVGEPSRGVIFPKYRGDLLESAVVTRLMHEGAIEPTVVPRNPLDVLAQQLVATSLDRAWAVDELYATRPAGRELRRARRATPSRRRSACSPGTIPPTSSPSSSRGSSGTAWRARSRRAATRGRSPSRPAARSPTAASSRSSSPMTARPTVSARRAGAGGTGGRPARRRARRGDGLRGARG